MTTNTTDQYWDIDGTVMTTPSYNIQELDGLEHIQTAQRRGSNIVAANHPGELWRPKLHAAGVKTMLMWVSYKDVNGVIADSREKRWGQFHANLDAIKKLIGDPTVQHVVTRRQYKTDGTLETRAFTGEVFASVPIAFAENDYWPSAEFSLDWTLADPYLYGAQQVVNIPLAGATLTHPGSIYARKMTVKLNGPLTNPVLTNTTRSIYVQYTGTIAAAHYVLLDTELMTAVSDLGANVIANVSRSGAREFMNLGVGANVFTLAASAGSGSADITYQPPYL